MKTSFARYAALSSLLLACSSSFLACGGDDDLALDPGDDDDDDDGGRTSSSGSTTRPDGGSSSGGRSSSSSGGSSGTQSSSSSSSSSGAAPTYSVGGTLSGLTAASVQLKDNGGDALTLTADGPFTFDTKLADGTDYAVTVVQPATNVCTLQNDTGTIDGADVGNVAVMCVPSYAVGGTVSGLRGTLQLGTTAGDTFTVNADGPFTMPTRLLAGDAYEVTIATQPVGQHCEIADGTESGTIAATDVTTVEVTCRNLLLSINEVYARPGTLHWGDANADGVRDSDDDQFIEIMNDETFEVSLAGVVVRTGINPAERFTYPAGATLPAGGRAVIFGGGTPTGSFGARTDVAKLSLSAAPANAFSVQLAGEIDVLDSFSWTGAATFTSNCDTDCASVARSPEMHGSALVRHSTTAPGILLSPGAPTAAAIPKLLRGFSLPPASALGTSITSFFRAQLNETMGADLPTGVTLYKSTCANAAAGVAVVTVPTLELGGSALRLTPAAALDYGQAYCVAASGVHSSQNVALDTVAPTTIDFTTRAMASAPAAGVVISQVGGPFGNTNNEFVELYNASDAEVNASGWFVQRRSAGGGTSCFATLPAGAKIAAHGFYLIGGKGYTNAVAADFPADPVGTTGIALTGRDETVQLLKPPAACGTASPTLDSRVDSVSYGAVTDAYNGLYLPAIPAAGTIVAVRRKACWDSTVGADPGTGIGAGGGQATDGSGEHIGASDADFLQPGVVAPRNAATAPQTRTCD